MNTENQVIKFVQRNTKYFSLGYVLPDSSHGSNYAVNYNNRIYHSNDTRELVTMICDDLKIIN